MLIKINIKNSSSKMFEDNNLLKIQEKEISIYTAENKTLPHNDVNILSARETKKIR